MQLFIASVSHLVTYVTKNSTSLSKMMRKTLSSHNLPALSKTNADKRITKLEYDNNLNQTTTFNRAKLNIHKNTVNKSKRWNTTRTMKFVLRSRTNRSKGKQCHNVHPSNHTPTTKNQELVEMNHPPSLHSNSISKTIEKV